MGAAAVLTTALIAAPAVMPLVESAHHDQELADAAHDAPAPRSVANAATAQSIAQESPVASAQPVTVARVEAIPAAFQRRAVPAQRRLRATPLPPAIRLMGLPSPAVASGPPPVILAANVTTDRPPRPLGRKLAGFLTGDGTYSVRPFPTVSSTRH